MAAAETPSEGGGVSLKDQGNEYFKAGNYLKAAALYTQAIKLDPSNPALYSNRSAAFIHLVKLNKALADAETTITLNSQWEKGHFRKGCVLEAMDRYDDALAAFQVALQYNPQSAEVTRKIKKLTQVAKDQKRATEVENMRTSIDMGKYLTPLKPELSKKFGEGWQGIFSFIVGTMDTAIKVWHDNGKVDPRANFLLNKEKTDSEKYAPVVNIDKAFESPHTHSSCSSFLRQYADESFSLAACIVAPKSVISYPQVWKGQGTRKWKHGQCDGFFVQLESPVLRRLWFVPSLTEKGRTLCWDPEALDVDTHEIIPRLFKSPNSNHT